jgi:hypothetical protein
VASLFSATANGVAYAGDPMSFENSSLRPVDAGLPIATDAFGNALGSSLAESISRPSLPSYMRNIPQEQQDRMLGLAQEAGLNGWSSDEKYQIIKDATDLRFSPDAQDLPQSEIRGRTSKLLGLLGANDEQIGQVMRNYEDAEILRPDNSYALQGSDMVLDDTVRQGVPRRAFLGASGVDTAVIGIGSVLHKFGDFVEENRIAKWTLEGLDIASGPIIYGVRHLEPVERFAGAVNEKVGGFFADGLSGVGRSDAEAQNGGIGGTALVGLGVGGFVGAVKSLKSFIADFKFSRMDVSQNPFGTELSRGANIPDAAKAQRVRPTMENRVIQGIDPRQLNRSHSIEGKRSTVRVEDIANDMKEKGFNGAPIDVVEANGEYYIVDGHHRAAAALQTGTRVDIRIIDDIKSHPSSWGSVEEVVRDAEMVGPNRLIPKGKYKK